MPAVVTIGELLVEIMRTEQDVPFSETGEFVGPYPSGAPGIFADAVARLDASVGMIGAVGDDAFGDVIVDRFERDGVETAHVERSGERATGVAFVAYFADGSRSFIFHMGNAAAGQVSPDDVPTTYVEDAEAVHLDGSTLETTESMRRACYRVVDIAREHGLTVSFDPNIRAVLPTVAEVRSVLDPVATAADIVTPTADELSTLTMVDDEAAAADRLLDDGAELVAVTKGAEGASLYTETGRTDVPAADVAAVDPTGAGDAFAAGLLVGHLEGMDLRECGRFASAAAAHAVTAQGPMEGLADRAAVEETRAEFS